MSAAQRRRAHATFLLAPLLLGGCGRTLVFAERDGFNLAISANPSQSAPLEVNAGLDRKIVSVVPPVVDGPAQNAAEGEAVNMFAGFRVSYDKADSVASPLGGDLRIRTQFATGRAALRIADNPSAVNRVVDVSTAPLVQPLPPDVSTSANALAKRIKQLSPAERAKLAGDLDLLRPGETLTDSDINARLRDRLARAASTPTEFPAFRARVIQSLGG